MKKYKFCLLIILSIASFGCSHEKQNGRLLASVGGTDLRMSEVAEHVDTSSAYAVRNYVSNWVDQQLLFDEATKEKLDNSPDFREKVDQFTRQLAITKLLDEKVYGPAVELTPDEISGFYNSHQDQFKAGEDFAIVSLAGFDARNYAVAFRNALVAGGDWTATFGEFPPFAILEVRDSAFVKASTVNPAIWNVIQSLDEGRISFPIQVDTVNYVVKVIRKIAPGETMPLSYADSFIRERLTVQKRRQLFQNLLNSLRSVGNFEIDPSVAVKDTGVD